MSKDSDVDDLLDRPKRQSLGQQALIWFLVIMVGVLFGMGPAVMILRGGGPADFGSVSQTEALALKQTETRFQRLTGRRAQDQDWTTYAQQIYQARYADQQGLMPKGETLEAEMRTFLDQEMPGGGTHRSLLVEYERSEHGVTADELERMLQINLAIHNLIGHATTVPVVPDRVADDLRALARDRVELASVELSTRALLDEFRDEAADDPAAIETLYRDLKERYFRIPSKRRVTVFAAEPDAIAEQVVLDDATIAEFYEAEKERRPAWRLPDEPDADAEDDVEAEEDAAAGEDAAADADAEATDDGPRYRPLSEVRDEIVAELSAERAVELARELYVVFHAAIEARMQELGTADPTELGIDDLTDLAAAASIGPDADAGRLAAPVSIRVVPDVLVVDPENEETTPLPGYGPVRVSRDLFNPDVAIGTLDEPISDTDGLMLMLRVEERIESSYRPLEAVRDELIDYRAGRLAWPALRTRAAEIAADATELGHDGLEVYFADEAVLERWQTAVATEQEHVLLEYQEPPEQLDGVPGERFPAIAIAGQQRPVRLVEVGAEGDSLADRLPRLRLIQATGYLADRPDEGGMQVGRRRNQYRNLLRRYQGAALMDRINQQLRSE